MKRHLALLLLLLMLFTFLSANIVDYYNFVSTTGTYTPIEGISVPSAIGDDALSIPVDIGFAFLYGQNSFSQLKICSNGYVALGIQTSHSYSNNLASSTYCPVLAPLWDDLSTASGDVQYLLSGTAPDRMLTIQYSNVQWNYYSTTDFSFQVKLYESRRIDFCYGPATGNPQNPSASIGINMQPGGLANYFSVTPGSPAAVSVSISNNGVSVYPGENVIYSFQPSDPLYDLAGLAITGNYTPIQGIASPYLITVRNNGDQAVSNYTVSLMVGQTVLAAAAGLAIPPQSEINVPVNWTPALVELLTIHGQVSIAGDIDPANNATPTMNVLVQPNGSIIIPPPWDHLARLPLDFYWKNSLCETITLSSELIYTATIITGVNIYNDFVTNLPAKPTKIWMGMTDLADLSEGWVPASEMTLVYDGQVDYPSGTNSIYITFQQPFECTQGNLVVLFQRPMDTDYFNANDRFHCWTTNANRTRYLYSDTVSFDPNNPPVDGGTLSTSMPTLIFYGAQLPTGQLSGTVTDTDNQPLQGVAVQTGNLPVAITNTDGHYAFAGIPAGQITLNVSKHGYHSQQQMVSIVSDSTVTCNFSLEPMATVMVTGTVVTHGYEDLPLPGALFQLIGYENYAALTDENGNFSLPSVYGSLDYDYNVTAPGHEPLLGEIDIGNVNQNIGPVEMTQYVYPPVFAEAQLAQDSTSVRISWLEPELPALSRGYRISRFIQGQENQQGNWVWLGDAAADDSVFFDTAWPELPTGTYKWAVNAKYLNGIDSSPTITNAITKEPTLTEDETIPLVTTLLGNYPNPFSRQTAIRYAIAKSDELQLSIYNIKGQLVRHLIDSNQKAGNYLINWDGTDEQNRRVSNGVYYCRMQFGQNRFIKKMLVLSD